jgi:hypothetical protein
MKILILCLLPVVAWGCNKDVRANLSRVAETPPPTGNKSFEVYCNAARQMEVNGKKYIGRTSWSPDQRDHMIAAAQGPINMISGLTNVRFGKSWESPFELRPNARGWRTIGRALAWTIGRSIKHEEYGAAIHSLRTAARMSSALASSDSQDADLGLEIVDECVDVIWPALPKLGAGQLNSVYEFLSAELEAPVPKDAAALQEMAVIQASAAWVQDAYQGRDFDAISRRLGKSVMPAVKYLRELTEKPANEQAEYFKNLQQDILSEISVYRMRLTQPPAEWPQTAEPKVKPWQRFVNAFGTSWRVYTEKRGIVRTRMRLLAIDAALLAKYKSVRSVPRDLSGFPQSLRKDPYSGHAFAYEPRGADYKLYSCGPNETDDGGEGDDIRIGR